MVTSAPIATIGIYNCSANIKLEAGYGESTAKATWKLPVASDINTGETLEVACDPASGSYFTTGQTIVECKASDNDGNWAACYFNVEIIGMFVRGNLFFSSNLVLSANSF